MTARSVVVAVKTLTVICLLGGSLPRDIEAQAPWKRHIIDRSSRGADGIRLGDINGDRLFDLATGWEQGGLVRVCVNPGPDRAAVPWPAVTIGAAKDVEDAVFVDLDADGAMEVVSCSEGKTRHVWVHWPPQERARLLDATAWQTEVLPASASTMMWMFALPLQVDGNDGVDLVAGGKGDGASIGWFQSPRNPRLLADWKWHSLRPVGWLMSLAASDMDGDGDTDIVFSDRKGRRSGAYWLENPGRGAERTQPWAEHTIGGEGTEAMFLEVVDLDRDGLQDVVLAVRPKELRWLRRLDRTGRAWESHSIPLPEKSGTAKAVAAADLTGDCQLELIFSCENAQSPAQGLMWLSSCDSPRSGKWQAHELSGPDGVKYDLISVLDLDHDGDLDVISTEEAHNLGVIWYENPHNGRDAR